MGAAIFDELLFDAFGFSPVVVSINFRLIQCMKGGIVVARL